MNQMSEPLVTVLTPVYNGEQFLAKCIESVLGQSYQNFEYIIVNNCSTDRSLEIADSYAKRDNRIRVHTNDRHVEIIENHNIAFQMTSARSKYCKVVSADDWLYPRCLEELVRVGEIHPSVGIIGSYQLSGGGTNWRRWRVKWDELPYPSEFLSAREVCRAQMLEDLYVFGTPTSLMYRADLVRRYPDFYPNTTAEADTSACYQCLQDSDFGFVHQVLSYERIHGSQMSEQSRTLNAYAPARLSDLNLYGHNWLTSEELSRRRSTLIDNYYNFLATTALHRPSDRFWAYHKNRLEASGYPFSYVKFGHALCAKIIDLLLNPKTSVEKLVRYATL